MAKKDVEQEDDFTFGDAVVKENDNETKDEIFDDKKDDKPDVVVEDDKVDKKEDKKATTIKEGKEDNKEVEEEKEEGDLFLDENTPVDEGKKISLKKIAKDLEIDLEKEDDEEEFKTKFSDRLAKSRSEFNLDGYSDDAKAIIKHLNENGGDIQSFFMNKNIISLQNVLSLDNETKVRNIRLQELVGEGKTPAEAKAALEEEIKGLGTRELKDIAAEIDSQAIALINDEVKKIVGDKEMKATLERQKTEAQKITERTNLKTFIDKQNNFLGLTLSPEAKKMIIRDIENGTFDKVLSNNEESIKFSSYMFSKYGAKIMKKIESSVNEANRSGYNSATRKHLDALHKTDEPKVSKKTGHESGKRDTDTGTKPKWSDEDFA